MTKEEFLEIAGKEYENLNALNKLDNLYDYEKGFVDIWRTLGRAVLQKNIGDPCNDVRKKKP